MTSQLQSYTRNRIMMVLPTEAEFFENHRPDWMINSEGERLELDFYIPSMNLAIEVQGEQHFRFVELFHVNKAGYEAQLRRDKSKKEICQKLGIRLIEVLTEKDIDDLVLELAYPDVKPTDYSAPLLPLGVLLPPEENIVIDEDSFVVVDGVKFCKVDGMDLLFFDKNPRRRAERLGRTGEECARVNVVTLYKALFGTK